MSGVAGILLAAGAAQRFGSNKLLAELPGGESVLSRAAANLAPAVDELWVVLSPERAEMQQCLPGTYHTTVCAAARDGIGHSLAHGVRQSPDAALWVIALADMPGIETAVITQVIRAARSGTSIARPVYRGQAGHPVVFGSAYYTELQALYGDRGAQSVVAGHADNVTLVGVACAGVVDDIDRPADLARFQRIE